MSRDDGVAIPPGLAPVVVVQFTLLCRGIDVTNPCTVRVLQWSSLGEQEHYV